MQQYQHLEDAGSTALGPQQLLNLLEDVVHSGVCVDLVLLQELIR